MFGLGWGELVVVGIVALIVVGPKDLPVMFRTMGRFMGKARGMAREFSRAMEAAADEAGVKDIQKDLRAMTSPKAMGMDALKKATDLSDWDPVEATKDKGEHTRKLAKERAEGAKKMREAREAKLAEKTAAAEADPGPADPAPAEAPEAAAKPKDSQA